MDQTHLLITLSRNGGVIVLSEKQKQYMELVTEEPGGIDVHELIERTGWTYKEIEDLTFSMEKEGIKLLAFRVGQNNQYTGWLNHFTLSPVDKTYKNMMEE